MVPKKGMFAEQIGNVFRYRPSYIRLRTGGVGTLQHRHRCHVSSNLALCMLIAVLILQAQRSTSRMLVDRMFKQACKTDTAASATRLESLLHTQAHHCSFWFSLAVFKLRQGCVLNAVSQLERGIERCDRGAESQLSRRQLHVFKSWIENGAQGAKYMYLPKRTFARYRCERVLHSISKHFGIYGNIATGFGSDSAVSPYSSQLVTSELPIHVQMYPTVQKARTWSTAQAHHIPNIIHFVYGFSDSPQVFGMHNYIAVASAKKKNPHCKILFHYMRQPIGKWWQHAKVLLDELIEHEDATEFHGQCLAHYAHKADVVRLKAISEHGGIYMDIDTISLQSWEQYQVDNQFILAEQDSPSTGTVREGKVYGLSLIHI